MEDASKACYGKHKIKMEWDGKIAKQGKARLIIVPTPLRDVIDRDKFYRIQLTEIKEENRK